MTVNRLCLIAAAIIFGVLFLIGVTNNGFDIKDLGWLGFSLFAAGHAV